MNNMQKTDCLWNTSYDILKGGSNEAVAADEKENIDFLVDRSDYNRFVTSIHAIRRSGISFYPDTSYKRSQPFFNKPHRLVNYKRLNVELISK